MTSFPLGFVSALVFGALALTACGLIMLLVLLWRDFRAGKLW